ncbi:MAG: transcriptional repressor, partial [Pseudaminobacter sp.]|nr:transcriptional repressor [Pseudaminobacter sp.]
MPRAKNQKPDYERMLRKAGVRITRPRRIILGILSGTEDHPDALEIFRRAVALDDTISLSTVYRTMKLLEGMGA